jgi:hypothetical protein
MRVLLHPVALFSLALLVANDHLFKAWWPGVVTGKLSDVAGMIVAPLVLVALVRALAPARAARSAALASALPWAAAIAVGVAFALAKTWAPATHAYEVALAAARMPFRAVLAAAMQRPLWGEHIVLVRDPTDLVALPFGLVSVWIARQRTLTSTAVNAMPPRLSRSTIHM